MKKASISNHLTVTEESDPLKKPQPNSNVIQCVFSRKNRNGALRCQFAFSSHSDVLRWERKSDGGSAKKIVDAAALDFQDTLRSSS